MFELKQLFCRHNMTAVETDMDRCEAVTRCTKCGKTRTDYIHVFTPVHIRIGIDVSGIERNVVTYKCSLCGKYREV